MLNIAGSNLRYPFHVAFLGFLGIGVILGLAYKSRTPDLYPGGLHNNIGWVLTVLVFVHFIVGILRSFTKHRELGKDRELTPFISSRSHEEDPDSDHPNQSLSPKNISPCPSRSDCPTEDTDVETLFDVHLQDNSRLKHRFNNPMSCRRRWWNVSESNFPNQRLDIGYDFVLRFFLILGFVVICTGIVTMAGIFVRTRTLTCWTH